MSMRDIRVGDWVQIRFWDNFYIVSAVESLGIKLLNSNGQDYYYSFAGHERNDWIIRGREPMNDFDVGDKIEVLLNDGWFWDRIKAGMQGVIIFNQGGELSVTFDIPGYGPATQSVSPHKYSLIRKVKKEIKKSGFAKFIQRVDAKA